MILIRWIKDYSGTLGNRRSHNLTKRAAMPVPLKLTKHPV